MYTNDLYQEEQQILGENAVIMNAWDAYNEELAKDAKARRFVRVAREYVPKLQTIFWKGELKWEAQEILRAILLEQTQPFNAIGDTYVEQNEDYVEADSYTLDPIEEGESGITQWDRDNIEVAREVRLLEEYPEYLYLDEDMYDLVRKIEQGDQGIKQDIEVVYSPKVGDIARIAQEYKDVYSDEQIGFILHANSYNISGDEEDIFYEAGEIPSVPIQQAEEQDLKTTKYMTEMRMEFRPLAQELHQRRTELFEWYRLNGWKTKEYKKFKKDTNQNYSAFKKYHFRKTIDNSLERHDIIQFLKKSVDRYEPQYIAVAFMSVQNDDWGLKMSDAKEIQLHDPDDVLGFSWGRVSDKVPSEKLDHTLYGFIDLFGDAILDEIESELGRSYATKETDCFHLIEDWEKELLSTFPEDSKNIRHTRAYMRGILNSITTSSNLNEAGYRQWMHEKSPEGLIAYQKVIKKHEKVTKDVLKKAWRAFWNAGRIKIVRRDGVVVVSTATGKEQTCNWGLAKWKINNGEIFLTKKDLARLKDILTSKGWGKPLLS